MVAILHRPFTAPSTPSSCTKALERVAGSKRNPPAPWLVPTKAPGKVQIIRELFIFGAANRHKRLTKS